MNWPGTITAHEKQNERKRKRERMNIIIQNVTENPYFLYTIP